MEDQQPYGKNKVIKREISFENGKYLHIQCDILSKEECEFIEFVDKALKSLPGTMSDFLISLKETYKMQ